MDEQGEVGWRWMGSGRWGRDGARQEELSTAHSCGRNGEEARRGAAGEKAVGQRAMPRWLERMKETKWSSSGEWGSSASMRARAASVRRELR